VVVVADEVVVVDVEVVDVGEVVEVVLLVLLWLAASTEDVGSDVETVDPFLLLAVTTTRRSEPRSATAGM